MSRRVKERVNFERIKTGVGTAFEYFLIRLIGLLDVEIKITSEKTQSSQSSWLWKRPIFYSTVGCRDYKDELDKLRPPNFLFIRRNDPPSIQSWIDQTIQKRQAGPFIQPLHATAKRP